MKIFTRVVINIETGRILEEDSFEYTGPLALCDGGGSSPPAAPVKTETENALDATQLDLLKQELAQNQQSVDYQQQMEPFMLESMGYKREDSIVTQDSYTPQPDKWVDGQATMNIKTGKMESHPGHWEKQPDLLVKGKTTLGKIIKLAAAERTPEQILQETSLIKTLAMQGYDAKGNKLTEAQMLENMTPAEKTSYYTTKKSLALSGYDTQGNKLTEEQILSSMTDAEKQKYNLTKLTGQREMDALEGKLPISPALESDLASEQTQAEEVLQRKLGKDWMLSTPGQSLMSKIKQKADLVREESRRGMITTAGGMAVAQEGKDYLANVNTGGNTIDTSGLTTTKLNQMMGFANGSKTDAFGDSLTLSSKYASERANQQNLAMQQWQAGVNSSNSQTSSMASGAAGIASAAAAAY